MIHTNPSERDLGKREKGVKRIAVLRCCSRKGKGKMSNGKVQIPND